MAKVLSTKEFQDKIQAMSKISHLKEAAISLRKEGKSYGKILRILGLKSKGTLSVWFKNLVYSEESRKLLEQNTRLAYERNLFEANHKRGVRIQKENEGARNEGILYINSLSKRELALIGAALYWGEGAKSEKTPHGGKLAFSNSDPAMIAIYMRFLREVLNVLDKNIMVGIHLYPSTDVEKSKDFWAETTKLSREKFYIITQVSRASQGKRPYNTLPHGTLSIKTTNRLLFFRVKGMIEGIGRQTK